MKLTGRPEAKLVVPSIGSTHHNHSFPSPFKLNSRASRVKERRFENLILESSEVNILTFHWFFSELQSWRHWLSVKDQTKTIPWLNLSLPIDAQWPASTLSSPKKPWLGNASAIVASITLWEATSISVTTSYQFKYSGKRSAKKFS